MCVVFLPGESTGQGHKVGCHLWSHRVETRLMWQQQQLRPLQEVDHMVAVCQRAKKARSKRKLARIQKTCSWTRTLNSAQSTHKPFRSIDALEAMSDLIQKSFWKNLFIFWILHCGLSVVDLLQSKCHFWWVMRIWDGHRRWSQSISTVTMLRAGFGCWTLYPWEWPFLT